MISEAIDFIDKYSEETALGLDWRIDKLAREYPKMVIIEAEMDNDCLSYVGFHFLAAESESGVQNIGSKRLRAWLRDNEDLIDKLDFNDYLETFTGKSRANKYVGSTGSLPTFSLFHLKLDGKWLTSRKGEFNKKLKKTKFSKKTLRDMKEIDEDKWKRLERDLNKINGEKGIRKVYKEFTEDIKNKFISREGSKEENEELIEKAFDGTYVYLRLLGNENLSKDIFQLFVSAKSFLREETIGEGNCQVCGKEGRVGLPDAFNVLNPQKKPFLAHRTRPIPYNLQLCGKCCRRLHEFERFLSKHRIDKFPLFIGGGEKKEEIKRIVKYLKDPEERQLRFFDIITHIDKHTEKETYNFVLMCRTGRGYWYYDYVCNYSFNLGTYQHYFTNDGFKENFTLAKLKSKLNNSLRIHGNYFGEVGKMEPHQKHLIYRYRERIFDLLYRNEKRISESDFHDICITLLESTIRNGKRPDQEIIDLYLNSSLFLRKVNKFLQRRDNKRIMLDEIREEKDVILKGKSPNIDSDGKFAYYLGQVIYYFIRQSEAKNKMRLLTPILDSRSVKDLKRALNGYIEQYHHNLSSFKDHRHKIIAGVIDYLDTELLDFGPEVRMPFYTGFFDENIMFKKYRGGSK